jgi:hypothetical protein
MSRLRSLLKLPESDFTQRNPVAKQQFATEIYALEKSLLWAASRGYCQLLIAKETKRLGSIIFHRPKDPMAGTTR